MSFTSHRRMSKRSASSWHGTATILEALLLLVFLLAAVALMTKTLALSYAKADEGTQLSAATMAAANTAEEFSANPTGQGVSAPSAAQTSQAVATGDVAASAESETRSFTTHTDDGFIVTCDVVPTNIGAGTLYRATINVYDGNASPKSTNASSSDGSTSSSGSTSSDGSTSSSGSTSSNISDSRSDGSDEPLYTLSTSKYVSGVD